MLAKLQATWAKARDAERAARRGLDAAYGHWWLAPEGKQKKYKAVEAREQKASDAIFAWLDARSPRDWRRGVPAHWICESLTEADALTSGPLSVIPPPSYGSYPSDSARFAQAVETAEVPAAW